MPRSTQLTNVRHRTTAPTSHLHGDTYFDEATQRLYVSWAGAWVPIGGGSSTWKQPVRMAAASNVTRSGTGTTIDGITPVVGDRVLLMGQTTATENGIYVVASGAWARATDASTGTDLIGAAVVVGSGAVYKDTTWLCTNDVLTLGTTPVVWASLGLPEVNVSTAGPSPRVGQLLWVDTDEASGTRLESVELTGPWPQAGAVSCPFKADVLIAWSASWYTTAGGITYMALTLDGAVQNGWAGHYFNETSSHKEVSGSIVVRGLAAGSHNWGVAAQSANVASDNADRGHLALTFVAVP